MIPNRIVTFENILTFLQQNWIKDQLQLSNISDTIWVEKWKIENDTNSWIFPRDESLSQLHISIDNTLKDLVYEAFLIRGDFLKSVFGGLVTGMFYFQFTLRTAPYNLTVDWKLQSETSDSQSLCQTLDYASDDILGIILKDNYYTNVQGVFVMFLFSHGN